MILKLKLPVKFEHYQTTNYSYTSWVIDFDEIAPEDLMHVCPPDTGYWKCIEKEDAYDL